DNVLVFGDDLHGSHSVRCFRVHAISSTSYNCDPTLGHPLPIDQQREQVVAGCGKHTIAHPEVQGHPPQSISEPKADAPLVDLLGRIESGHDDTQVAVALTICEDRMDVEGRRRKGPFVRRPLDKTPDERNLPRSFFHQHVVAQLEAKSYWTRDH